MNLTVGATGDITAAQIESVIMLAVNCLKLFGAELTNMAGAEGSRTISLEDAEHAAVLLVSRMIYLSFFKPVEKAVVNGVSITTDDVLANPASVQLIQTCANALKTGQTDENQMQVMAG